MGQKSPPEDQAKRNNMNILGIDFGTKRIGLAWVQIGLDVILPFGVVVCQCEEVKALSSRIVAVPVRQLLLG